MSSHSKLGVARQALDQFLNAVNTPGGQAAVSSVAGGAAGYAGSELFNSISPVDIDPEMAAGIGGTLGAFLGPQALRKAQARMNAGKYGTQMSIPGL